jgi:adenylate cyclase
MLARNDTTRRELLPESGDPIVFPRDLRVRRFVQSALADQLARGEGVASGERGVSVLFADLRNYTRLVESRTAAEIFRFLSAYTRIVSEIVHARGGVVLEFSGDGLMAVFGAPEEVPRKESAALESALEIVDAMAAFGLAVGIGIASGPVFLGCLPAADRLIWCAVGNTTILASRLQGLSRKLGACVVVDERTIERTSQGKSFVRHERVRIRGRRRLETLYALPGLPPRTNGRARSSNGGS